jgi:hypothetical protein
VVTAETSGKVVVDGIEASSFGVNHAAANTFYMAHRLMYSLGLSSLLQSEAVVGANMMLGNVGYKTAKFLGVL